MTDSNSPICRRVVFHGRVQGVGFRMTTERVAKKYDVVGCVKNLPDGTVEVLVKAPEEELERFLHAIRQQFPGYIEAEDSVRCEESMKIGLEKCRVFTVRY